MIGDRTPGDVIRSTTHENSHVISEVPCVIRYVKAANVGGPPTYLMVFDAASLPANGTLPARTPVAIPTNGVNGDTWGAIGTRFRVGCVVALSTTLETLTLSLADHGLFEAEVVR